MTDGSLSRRADDRQQRVEPAVQRPEDVTAASLDRTKSRNTSTRPLHATLQPSKSPSHRAAAAAAGTSGSLSTVPRSYCGIGWSGRSADTVLLLPAGHARDILLRQSRERLASAGSSGGGVGADAKSAAAYLGGPRRRATTARHRTAGGGLAIRCWPRPESSLGGAERSTQPPTLREAERSVVDEDNRFSTLSSARRDEIVGDAEDSEKVAEESPTDDVPPSVYSMPVTSQQLSLTEFRKVGCCCTLVFL